METKVEFNVLESIESIYKLAQDSLLRPPFFDAKKIFRNCLLTVILIR